jgi:hypothetical protein
MTMALYYPPAFGKTLYELMKAMFTFNTLSITEDTQTCKREFNSILKRMSHIHDLYRLVKVIQSETRKNNRRSPPPEQLVGFSSRHPATLVIKKRFIRWRPWLSLMLLI